MERVNTLTKEKESLTKAIPKGSRSRKAKTKASPSPMTRAVQMERAKELRTREKEKETKAKRSVICATNQGILQKTVGVLFEMFKVPPLCRVQGHQTGPM